MMRSGYAVYCRTGIGELGRTKIYRVVGFFRNNLAGLEAAKDEADRCHRREPYDGTDFVVKALNKSQVLHVGGQKRYSLTKTDDVQQESD